jgi:hypothetical protein
MRDCFKPEESAISGINSTCGRHVLVPARRPTLSMYALITLFATATFVLGAVALDAAEPAWVPAMKETHAQFKGTPGTFAQFGDSITVTLAFWAPLESKPKNMPADAARAWELVRKYQKPECWRAWKGPQFGSNGGMTIRWAEENVDAWLAKLNPEVAVIMFGSNDVAQVEVKPYQATTRAVVEKCLKHGTVPILTTMPPRNGHEDKSRQFAEAARQVAAELRVPLCDYYAEIVKRRPDDWNGALPQFKGPGGEYEVATLISRDGVHPSNPRAFGNDFSEDALKSHGFGLRNYLTLLSYAEVIERVCRPGSAPK